MRYFSLDQSDRLTDQQAVIAIYRARQLAWLKRTEGRTIPYVQPKQGQSEKKTEKKICEKGRELGRDFVVQ